MTTSRVPAFSIISMVIIIGATHPLSSWAVERRDAFKKGQTEWSKKGATEASGSCEMSNSSWVKVSRAAKCCGASSSAPDALPADCARALYTDEYKPIEVSAVDGGVDKARAEMKAGTSAAASLHDRFAGVCTEVVTACEKFTRQTEYPACTNPAVQSQCSEAKIRTASVLEKADSLMSNSNSIDPGTTASDPNSGSGAGAGGGEAPTQQPGGGGGGGGNPLEGLMSALQQAMQPKPKEPVDRTPQTCEQNPALAGCPTTTKAESDSWNKKAGESGFETESASSDSGDNFNVGSNDGINNAAYAGNGERQYSPPPTGGTGVPNGGGGIPGGGGGGAAGAPGGANNGGYAGPQKKLTDIMQGMMGGGYSQMNQGMQMQNGTGGGGFSGYGGGRGEYRPGMDLKQFLPGGKQDPTRKLAGGAAVSQIQPQTVNIWNRISERIRARCTQGLLRDCGP